MSLEICLWDAGWRLNIKDLTSQLQNCYVQHLHFQKTSKVSGLLPITVYVWYLCNLSSTYKTTYISWSIPQIDFPLDMTHVYSQDSSPERHTIKTINRPQGGWSGLSNNLLSNTAMSPKVYRIYQSTLIVLISHNQRLYNKRSKLTKSLSGLIVQLLIYISQHDRNTSSPVDECLVIQWLE